MDDKQKSLQSLLLEMARIETKIDESNIEEYIFRFQDIYSDDFRHFYSGVFGVITRVDAREKHDLNILLRNVNILHAKTKELYIEKKGHITEDFFHKIEKLYDHVNLDASRIVYTKELAQRIEDANENTVIELKKLREEAEKSQKDYVTILGIFSSIVITFVAGMVFSGSVLNNIDKVSIYRLTFVMLSIALLLFNLLRLLLDFIKKINQHGEEGLERQNGRKSQSVITDINVMLFLMMVVDIVLWAFYWYRATGYKIF